MMLRGDAHAVIPDKEYRKSTLRILTALTDLYIWRILIAHIFGGVIDQVLQNLHKARTVSINSGKVRLDMNGNPLFLQSSMNDIHSFPDQFIKCDYFRCIHHPADARKFKEFAQQSLHLVDCLLDPLHIFFQTFYITGEGILFEITEKTVDGDQR